MHGSVCTGGVLCIGCIELSSGLKLELSVLTSETDADSDVYELEVVGK